MRKPVILFLIIIGVLALGAYLLLPGSQRYPIEVQSDGTNWVPLKGNEFRSGMNYTMRLKDLPEEDQLLWILDRDSMGGRATFESQVAVIPFKQPGSYTLIVTRDLKEVARDSFQVLVGDRVDIGWPDAISDTLGGKFLFTDRSANVKSRQWRVLRGDTAEVEQRTEEEWTWAPRDVGQYTVVLELNMGSGAVNRDSTRISVLAPPPPPVVVEVVKPKPVPKKKDPPPVVPKKVTPPKPPKPKPQPVEKPPPAEKPPPPPSPIGNCFSASRNLSTNLRAPIATPDRKDVAFRAGATSFTITPHEDCQLIGFKYFGNHTTGKIKVTVTCTTDECAGARSRSISPFGAANASGASVLDKLNLPVLAAGKTYTIRIEPIDGGELGFFDLKTSSQSVTGMELQMNEGSSCVYDLKFLK